jgi:hypothetical protein
MSDQPDPDERQGVESDEDEREASPAERAVERAGEMEESGEENVV